MIYRRLTSLKHNLKITTILLLIAAVETADSQQRWIALNKVQADFMA
ncbi:MAG: hypothetical protein ABL887_04270 [Nitrosomonas sp.]